MSGDRRWGKSEFFSLSTFVLVVGWIVWASQHVQTWNVVTDAKKGNDALDTRVTTLEVHVRDKDDEVLQQLAAIYRKVR